LKFHFSTLRSALLVPFVGLTVLLTLAISALFYLTGLRGVEAFSTRMLQDVAYRVNTATIEHLSSSNVVLEAAAPDARRFLPNAANSIALLSPQLFEEFEPRLWHASGLFPENGYVFFGAADGRFIGISRSPINTELRLKATPTGPRIVYQTDGPGTRGAELHRDALDPVSRPWYKAALARNGTAWSPVYASTSTKELKITLAKPMLDASGAMLGVIATDVTLRSFAEFVRSLKVSKTGVAFVVEPTGELIATSTPESLLTDAAGAQRRLKASESANPYVRTAYATFLESKNNPADAAPSTLGASTLISQFSSDSGVVDLAATHHRDAAGLDWTIIVALPRQDFMGELQRTLWQNLAIGLLAVCVAIGFGLWLTQRIVRDVNRLSEATHLLASGQAPAELHVNRRDELGSMARTMYQLSTHLLKDPLTGALNRHAFDKRFSALANADVTGRTSPFALVFIDLDSFKLVNDQHGHAMGDAVLAITAQRLASTLHSGDVLGRFGGDEFLLMLENIADKAALDAALEQVRSVLEPPINIAGQSFVVRASCGGALFPSDGATLDALTRTADSRMYGVKAANARALKDA